MYIKYMSTFIWLLLNIYLLNNVEYSRHITLFKGNIFYLKTKVSLISNKYITYIGNRYKIYYIF